MPPRLPYSEAELLQLIVVGDEKAYTVLYYAFSPYLFQVAMMYAGQDTALAEEFVQQVFIRLWEKKAVLASVRNIEDFIFIMARNIIFDHFKKTAHDWALKKTLPVEDHTDKYENNADRYLEEKELAKLLQKAISQLPLQQRLVYKLSRQEGMNHEQIATSLRLSISTVQTHMKLAVRTLRKYISAHLLHSILVVFILEAWSGRL